MPERIHILVIGGGCGGALAHDLVLRGFRVTLVERGAILSGTTGRHHGLLHSGARYVFHDVPTARECWMENRILRRLAPAAIEPNGGLFAALEEDDLQHVEAFAVGCEAAGIPLRRLEPQAARRLEPALAPHLRTAFQVPDASMDAWRLALSFFATAKANGAAIRPFTEVTGLRTAGRTVTGIVARDHRSGRRIEIGADLVVNAAGPWAGRITAMIGLQLPLRPGPGVMVAVAGRLVNMVINRLQPAGEGDIVVPQRRLSIVGTTALLADDPDPPAPPADQVERLIALGARLIPALAARPVHSAWCAARPLLDSGTEQNPMRISRAFDCLDHQVRDGWEGLVTLVGGKATTMRAMAEQTADRICRKTGIVAPCRTRDTPLLSYRCYYA